MAATSDFSAAKSLEASGFATLLDNLVTRFTQYRLYRQTVNELSELSNRELDDLGLNRSMIRRVAYQAAYENGGA
ncbi:protein of unknown function [Cribrihabitans marinus]|uniref:YjiS-like domain-containing protein n=1 Tax=Cribrihabitans marinus TaxID=1227549 RepID=A0A1H6ZQT0_9RHOB|nr:DUF1127 domain-containing protein [Cribrihabitans marinus]GGH30178.1 hypothetical protein GCM10010973_20120 [Cribrihabitans marinus]SEJ55789.1 protein of unknown function [Cribrihabitans marinus]